jgi:calcium/calmodulin-dependent protein kinase I
MKEFKILTEVNHRNICQLYSVFETENSTYVILELYPLSLYGYLQKCGFPNIDQAKVIMINLLEGILYLHKKGIMHRDLKLENIMVKRDDIKTDRVIPVIVDFGLAEYLTSTKYLYTRCGTPGYVAPEVLKIKSTDPVQTYSCACDIFSLGVIFHILYLSIYPVCSKSQFLRERTSKR